MYGDTAVVRALARSMRERAGDLRADAVELAAHAEAVPWAGLAADAMRGLARRHAQGLRACAGAHDAAADALDSHAREVDRVEDLIAAVERRACHLLESAAGGLGGLIDHVVPDRVDDCVPDCVDEWAHRFDPPPPGSLAWLDVHLPRSA
jgi:hypothetical protein